MKIIRKRFDVDILVGDKYVIGKIGGIYTLRLKITTLVLYPAVAVVKLNTLGFGTNTIIELVAGGPFSTRPGGPALAIYVDDDDGLVLENNLELPSEVPVTVCINRETVKT